MFECTTSPRLPQSTGSRRAILQSGGIVSSILEWFDYDAPDRRDGLVEYILAPQKADGSWTGDSNPLAFTINVLEALQIRNQPRPSDVVDAAMRNAHDDLPERSLFRSLDTGDPIRPSFTRFSFPPRRPYDVLRALDHLQAADAPTDPRVADAIDLVRTKRRANDTWPLQNRHSGKVHLEMEAPGEPSRWNTLRALRVLRWWADSASP